MSEDIKPSKPTKPTKPTKHDFCFKCYFKNNNQNPNIFNECTLCLFNINAVKTNNFKVLPTAKRLA